MEILNITTTLGVLVSTLFVVQDMLRKPDIMNEEIKKFNDPIVIGALAAFISLIAGKIIVPEHLTFISVGLNICFTVFFSRVYQIFIKREKELLKQLKDGNKVKEICTG